MKIARSEWAVLNLIEHGLIDDNFDGHPGPDDIPAELFKAFNEANRKELLDVVNNNYSMGLV